MSIRQTGENGFRYVVQPRLITFQCFDIGYDNHAAPHDHFADELANRTLSSFVLRHQTSTVLHKDIRPGYYDVCGERHLHLRFLNDEHSKMLAIFFHCARREMQH